MAGIHIPTAPPRSTQTGIRLAVGRRLSVAMEAVVLLLVCLAPWPFGSVHPGFEFLLDAGLAVLLCLWAAALLVAGKISWKFCPASLCLAGLILLGLGQLVTLPRPMLGWLSPGTTALYDRLLPAEAEVLPFGAPRARPPHPLGSTITLDPGATRAQVMQLLAVFALFAVVRQHLASPASLRRLCLAALVNGTLLALFALVQFWTSRPNIVYWTYPSLGTVYGPFINRNHAAGYLNLCLGLGLGLLLCRLWRRGAPRAWWQDDGALRLLFALAILTSGIILSLSRGGLCALMGAAGLCLVLGHQRQGLGRVSGSLLLVAVPALALLAWFGTGSLLERLDTALEKGDPGRLAAWSRVLPLVKDFPFWGTGYGTFGPLENMQRTDATDANSVFSHAHNEFVEALVEGGLTRLLLSLGLVAFVVGAGYRAVRHPVSPLSADLALGALFAVVTSVLHSVVDFGIHVPALALLLTVVCAQLVALGQAGENSLPGAELAAVVDGPGALGARRGVLAPALAAVAAVTVGLVLVAEGWRVYRVDGLQVMARHGRSVAGDVRPEEQIAWLEAAARLAPENAQVHLELARAHLRQVQDQKEKRVQRLLMRETAQAALALLPAGVPAHAAHSALIDLPSWLAVVSARPRLLQADEEALLRALLPALQAALRARDTSPLLTGPHLELATHRNALAFADSPLTYLGRAKFLAPADPDIWYYCGLQDLVWLHPHLACADWRHSLQLSPQNLQKILDASAVIFSAEQIFEQIIPERPGQLLDAVSRLIPDEDTARRKPLLEKALSQLERQQPPLQPQDLHHKAVILTALEQRQRAVAAYQAALDQEPQRADWRFEYARLLHAQARLQETRRELLQVLDTQASHAEARTLLLVVTREIAETR